MSKIIDLQSYKNKERKEIEDKAYQQYGILCSETVQKSTEWKTLWFIY